MIGGAKSHTCICVIFYCVSMNNRKAQQKRVVYIPAASAVSSRPGAGENVPSDLWAWRKYGQKPIKGSPHPRYKFFITSLTLSRIFGTSNSGIQILASD